MQTTRRTTNHGQGTKHYCSSFYFYSHLVKTCINICYSCFQNSANITTISIITLQDQHYQTIISQAKSFRTNMVNIQMDFSSSNTAKLVAQQEVIGNFNSCITVAHNSHRISTTMENSCSLGWLKLSLMKFNHFISLGLQLAKTEFCSILIKLRIFLLNSPQA